MKLKIIVYEAEEGGLWAEVPALPGCLTQAETLDVGEAPVRVNEQLGSDDRRGDDPLADLLGWIGEPRRDLKPVAQRGASLRRLDRIDPLRKRPAIARVARNDLRRVGKLDDHRQIVGVHVAYDFLGRLFRLRGGGL